MRRTMFVTGLMYGLLALAGLTACSSMPPPPSPEAVADQPAAVTQPPTVAAATASPTPVQSALPTATATATPQPASPTPAPSPTVQRYVVEQYDTLLGIALAFDTTVELLARTNGLNEEEFLQIGQELIIPSPGGEGPAAPARDEAAPELALAAEATSAEPATVAAPVATASPTLVSPATATPIGAQQATTSAESVPASPVPPTATLQSGDPLPPPVSRAANINPLTGLPVDDPATLRRRPLLVRIGNDAGARQSQAGLNSADIVYEEITEWWVTRFTAIFLAEAPNIVAPIRSARLINVQLAPQYQGALAHSGGSDPVRWEISQAPITNLDEYYNPAPYFYRPNEGWQTRLAIDTEAARDYMAANGLAAPVTQIGFTFSDTIDRGEPAENIFIPYPRATSFTQWRYNPASGQYLRFINDQPLADVSSGQVTAANVIVYFAEHQPTEIVEDSNGATSIRTIVNGRGPAWFFRDGRLNKGFWQTDGSRTPYFGYEDGSPYPLKPGNSWIEVVPTYYTIGLTSASEASSRP